MNAQVITFNCILKNKAGHIISTTFNRDVLTYQGRKDFFLSGLSKGLKNLKQGEKRSIFLSAAEAYGFYEPQKIILYPRQKLPKTIKVGEIISITLKSGKLRSYKIIQLHDNMVSLDGNHPLAGQDLIFEIETLSARKATEQELEESLNTLDTQLLH